MKIQGKTLLLDVLGVERELLCSEEILKLLLLRTVEVSGLTPLKHTIQIEHFPIKKEERFLGDFGISMGIILVESHAYLHTWPEHEYMRFELSSCKNFPGDRVVSMIKKILNPEAVRNITVPWNPE